MDILSVYNEMRTGISLKIVQGHCGLNVNNSGIKVFLMELIAKIELAP
jgi:hypothetical protein